MLYLKALGIFLIAAGAITVFGSRWIVKNYNLEKTATCNFEHEMNEVEIEQYKLNKALVKVKMIGMLVALPGIVTILVIFR